MSDYLPERNVGPEPPRYAAETDAAPYSRFAMVGAAVLLVFAIAVFAMWQLQKSATASRPPPPPVPDEIGKAEINGVNQVMFDLENGAQRLRREDERVLSSYGWVDADAGIAHIPVEEAIRLVAARAGGGSHDGGAP